MVNCPIELLEGSQRAKPSGTHRPYLRHCAESRFAPMSTRSPSPRFEEIAEAAVMQRMRQNTTLATVVLMSLAVGSAGCGGGSKASSPPPASSNPTVVLFSLSPVSVTVGGNGFTLTVSGSNFASSRIVRWNGESVPNTFVSSQQVTAKISPSLIASAGFASVTAQNANSSVSNALEFRVNNPAPQIASISPGSAMAGAAPLFLAVSGSSFVSGATLLLNGSPRPISFGCVCAGGLARIPTHGKWHQLRGSLRPAMERHEPPNQGHKQHRTQCRHSRQPIGFPGSGSSICSQSIARWRCLQPAVHPGSGRATRRHRGY